MYRIGHRRTLAVMDAIARLLQIGGMTLPIVAILAQLNQAITEGQMLMFLVASLCLFYIGYILRGGGRTE